MLIRLFFSLFIFGFGQIYAQIQTFEKTIRSTKDDSFQDAIEIPGGYVCAIIENDSLGIINTHLSLLDNSGNIIKNKYLDSVLVSSLTVLFPISSVEYLGAGTTKSIPGKGQEIILISFDQNLNINWTKSYGQAQYNETPSSIAMNLKGDLIIVGEANNVQNQGYVPDIFIYEFNIYGDSIKARYFPYPGLQLVTKVLASKIAPLYYMFSFGFPTGNPWLSGEVVTLDTAFQVLDISDSLINGLYFRPNAVWVSDTSYMLTGRKKNVPPPPPVIHYGNEKLDIAVTLQTISGEVQAFHWLGKQDTAEFEVLHSVDVGRNGEIWVGGTSNFDFVPPFPSSNPAWYMISKLDKSGILLWTKYIGGDKNYFLNKVLATSDGGILLGGSTYDTLLNAPGERDVYITKLDGAGNLTSLGGNILDKKIGNAIFPNPVKNTLYLKTNRIDWNNLTLFHTDGKKVASFQLLPNQYQVDVSEVGSGIYFFLLENEKGFMQTGKIIKQ